MSDTIIIGFLISFAITISVYTLPIIIYRFAIVRHPVERKKAKIITLAWAILGLIIMVLLINVLTGEAITGGGLLLWSFVNYGLLTGGKARNLESPSVAETPAAKRDAISPQSSFEHVVPEYVNPAPYGKIKYPPEQMYSTIKKLRRSIVVFCVLTICICSTLGVTLITYRAQSASQISKLEAQNDEYLADIKTSAGLIVSSLNKLKDSDKKIIALYDEFIPPASRSDSDNPLSKYMYSSSEFSAIRKSDTLNALIDKYPDFYQYIP